MSESLFCRENNAYPNAVDCDKSQDQLVLGSCIVGSSTISSEKYVVDRGKTKIILDLAA